MKDRRPHIEVKKVRETPKIKPDWRMIKTIPKLGMRSGKSKSY